MHFNTARASENNFCSNKITTYLCVGPPPARDPLLGAGARPHAQNRSVACRYTWYNFLPKILFEEFSKLAYFYFLARLRLLPHRTHPRGRRRCVPCSARPSPPAWVVAGPAHQPHPHGASR